jgi:hypothetical protein
MPHQKKRVESRSRKPHAGFMLQRLGQVPKLLQKKRIRIQARISGQENLTVRVYLLQVSLVLEQLKGLAAGYNAAATPDKQLTLDDFLRMNSDGDFYDLIPALKLKKKGTVAVIDPACGWLPLFVHLDRGETGVEIESQPAQMQRFCRSLV